MILWMLDSGKKEKDPGVLLPGQQADRKAASDVRFEDDADRKGFLKVTNRSSQRIIIESLSTWTGEQEDDCHEEEEGTIPTAL